MSLAHPDFNVKPNIVVVEGDQAELSRTRHELEADGACVLEAKSLCDARRLLSELQYDAASPDVDGVVIDHDLPDGEGAELLADVRDQFPSAQVVLLTEEEPEVRPPTTVNVARGDMRSLISALSGHSGLLKTFADEAKVISGLGENQEKLVEQWLELCEWDPMVPPGSRPAMAEEFVDAVCGALGRPQPLGWGADEQIERVAAQFAGAIGAIDAVIGQLVCLREAFRRYMAAAFPSADTREVEDRLAMIVDRAIGVAAQMSAERLQREAFIDTLTGLLNRRALERDLTREIGRAERYGRSFTFVLVDLDGLKVVNDNEGHSAGDERLRGLADALQDTLRQGDSAYRIGGDEFVILLPETAIESIKIVMNRVAGSGAPSFSWGVSLFPTEGRNFEALQSVADDRLFNHRRRVRSSS